MNRRQLRDLDRPRYELKMSALYTRTFCKKREFEHNGVLENIAMVFSRIAKQTKFSRGAPARPDPPTRIPLLG